MPGDHVGDGLGRRLLWIGEYNASKVHQVDPQTGAIVRTSQSDHFVTGVTWVQGELWHGTLQDALE